MSAVIRSQVVRLLRDAIDELETHPEALTSSELYGLGLLATMFNREELGQRLAMHAFKLQVGESEPGG